MFGIVTTGQRWQFVRWSESLDELPVYISDEHICNFTDDFKIEIKVVKYIAQILQTQVQHFIIMIMIMKTTSILQNINGKHLLPLFHVRFHSQNPNPLVSHSRSIEEGTWVLKVSFSLDDSGRPRKNV